MSFADWDRCVSWLQEALERDPTHTLDEVRALCAEHPGGFQFWPGERSAVVTQVVEQPRFRELHVWLAGGDLAEVRAGLPSLEAFAAAVGCRRITLFGRPGWGRVLPDFEVQFVALAKVLP